MPGAQAATSSPRLRIVTGKGGVGKTTVAAALALAEARRGRRVLLAEVKAGDRAAALLAVKPTGFDLREVLPKIHLVDMNPDDAIHEYALMILRFERLYRIVFDNRLVRSFIHIIPSVGELVMLGKLWYHERELEDGRPRFDVIVLDAPATGHALALLRTPSAVKATVPEGPLRVHADNMEQLLRDQKRTVLHIVTTPEEMPITEAIEIDRAARESFGIRVGTTIVNHTVAALPQGVLERVQTVGKAPGLEGAVRALAIREAKRLAGEAHLGGLPDHLRQNLCRLPRLVGASFGRSELETLADVLESVTR
jgi:anion-transporting  ArsA/GET3 family ATPase